MSSFLSQLKKDDGSSTPSDSGSDKDKNKENEDGNKSDASSSDDDVEIVANADLLTTDKFLEKERRYWQEHNEIEQKEYKAKKFPKKTIAKWKAQIKREKKQETDKNIKSTFTEKISDMVRGKSNVPKTTKREMEEALDNYEDHIPRKFAVVVSEMRVKFPVLQKGEEDSENLHNDPANINCFVQLEFGGDFEEYKVLEPGMEDPQIYALGKRGTIVRSPELGHVVRGHHYRLPFSERFEWTGTYHQVQTQPLIVSVWRHRKASVNAFMGESRQTLATYADGPIFSTIDLFMPKKDQESLGVKYGTEDPKPTCTVELLLQFQEVFDFHLCFQFWNGRNFSLPPNKGWNPFTRNTASSASGVSDSGTEGGSRPSSPASQFRKKKSFTKHLADSLTDAFQNKVDPYIIIKLKPPANRRKIKHSIIAPKIQSRPEYDTGTPSWMEVGEFSLRCTANELQNTKLEVIVKDTAPGTDPELGRGILSMNGVLDSRYLQGYLHHPKGATHKPNENLPFVAGAVCFRDLPRFRQHGDYVEMDKNGTYLVLKFDKINKVLTADNRSPGQINTIITAGFDGCVHRTRIVLGTEKPDFDGFEMAFDFRLWNFEPGVDFEDLDDKEVKLLEEEISEKKVVRIDVWVARKGNSHEVCGANLPVHDEEETWDEADMDHAGGRTQKFNSVHSARRRYFVKRFIFHFHFALVSFIFCSNDLKNLSIQFQVAILCLVRFFVTSGGSRGRV